MSRKAETFAVCRVVLAKPRSIEHVFGTFTDRSTATGVMLEERTKAKEAGVDPYTVALLPYDRKVGAYLPLD